MPSVEDRARERSHIGASVGAMLRDASVAVENADALAISDLITESASQVNYCIASDLYNEHGEAFEGLFVLAPLSSSRLDPNYIADCARRARKRVKEKLAPVVLKYQEQLRRRELYLSLVTLTMPTQVGIGMRDTFRVFDDAWVRLRKSVWWANRVRGALKGEECTLGDNKRLKKESRKWEFERDGYHVHAHIMGVMEWLKWDELGELWKRCLLRSAAKHKVRINFATSHGRPVVDVRQVLSKGKGRSITFDDAVYEVCKYVVKGSEFSRMPAEHLIEVEETLRGRRMIELLGELNNRKGSAKGRGEARTTAEDDEAARAQQAAQLDAARRFLDEAEAQWKAQSLQGHTLDRARLNQFALACAERYLDETAQLTEGRPRDGTIKPKKRRAPPLRLLGAEMIRRGQRESWLLMMQEIARKRREWRKSDLIRLYPYATFRTLAGKEWFGLLTNPASAAEPAKVLQARSDWHDVADAWAADEPEQERERAEFRQLGRAADRGAWRAAVASREAFEMFSAEYDWLDWGLSLKDAFKLFWWGEQPRREAWSYWLKKGICTKRVMVDGELLMLRDAE